MVTLVVDPRVEVQARADLLALVRQLDRARVDARCTQRVLAERLGVTPGSVVDWTVGRDAPTMAHFILWARELGLVLRVTQNNKVLAPDVPDGLAFEIGEMRRLALALWGVRGTLSQRVVAQRMGMNRWSVARWESGGGYPRPVALLMWAAVLGCGVGLFPLRGSGSRR